MSVPLEILIGCLSQRALAFLALGCLATGCAIYAQDPEAPSTLQLGERLFLTNCAQCHGPEGDAIPGFDIGHGKFRHTNTDAGLADIINHGIPGTAMPPHTFTGFAPGVSSAQSQVGAIIAYMHYLAESSLRDSIVSGDASRGQAIFEKKGGCLACHAVRGQGSHLGPDLGDIGAARRPAELQRSIQDPAAEVLPQNRFVRVVPRSGASLTGRLLNQDAFSVQLIDAKEQIHSFWRADLREFTFLDGSIMPSYKDKLSAEEISDLVNYLVSLKGFGK
jgi:putative heme-binding domain-containing protein